MKKLPLFSALLMASCIFFACHSANNESTSAESPVRRMDGPSDTDTSSFMYKAALAGQMEVELGEIAVQMSKSQAVKDFGAMMIRDHNKVHAELESLAVVKKMTLPTVYPNRMSRRINDMKKLNGRAFEKQYMSMMVEDQSKFQHIFQDATKDKDPAISDLAKRTLPVIEKHHQQATQIHNQIEND